MPMLESAAWVELSAAVDPHAAMSEYDAPDNTPSHAPEPRRVKPRLKKRRTLMVVLPLMVLALISTVFGMMMAVAADLPSLEQIPQTTGGQNSVMVDIHGKKLATLTSNEGRIIASNDQIGAYVKYAVIATEDERFYENSGVDLKGIGRAFVQDLVSGGQAVQGGSTITQQFVKVAAQNQNQRTVFNKLRESALAYHLTHKWDKDKILTEYLNAIYFGNGAYGIESAARTYFGSQHPDCGDPQATTDPATGLTTTPTQGGKARPCALELKPSEAAMLAAIIASPTGFDPAAHPVAAQNRRNMVLKKMLDQDRLTQSEYQDALSDPIPTRDTIHPPRVDSNEPYFTSWARQVLVDRVGPRKAFEGGLKVKTTIDVDLQKAARDAIGSNLYRADGSGPTASLVAIDNATGEVRAMVGGQNERDRTQSVQQDYLTAPFNLATQGQRQPGSSIKPFILATALEQGIGPGSVWPSQKREFTVPHTGGKEKFPVKNFGGFYYGKSTLADALTHSDNSVFAAVGIHIGTDNVAKTANAMGVRTPVSTNYAMTLGGLKQGVTPLDMAHAYSTFAEDGNKVTGSLGATNYGPVPIRSIESLKTHDTIEKNKRRTKRAITAKAAKISRNLMLGPVRFGTAKRAQISGQVIMGKTGTTENNGDAWFIGYTQKYTVAVWVGYPNSVKSMDHDYFGDEVTGGTFPAVIWRQFMLQLLTQDKARVAKIKAAQAAKKAAKEGKTTPSTATPSAPVTTAPSSGTSGGTQKKSSGATQTTTPAPAPAPSTGTGNNGTGAGGVTGGTGPVP